MRICSLVSGSSGNSIVVNTDSTNILLDCGASAKYIVNNVIEVVGTLPDAILITHEHIDHIKSLGTMLRKYEIPVYLTNGTLKYIRESNKIGKINLDLVNIIKADKEVKIGDIYVMPFAISHDAKEPIAFTFRNSNKKISVATDLGRFDDYTIEHLKNSNAMLLEANYDEKLLECGSYPFNIKQRIKSAFGHLSNNDTSNLLVKIFCDKLKNVLLGHISSENNYSDLAELTVKNNLKKYDIDLDRISIETAGKEKRSSIIEV